MMICNHEKIDWKHQTRVADCPTCVEQGDACDVVVCAECHNDVDANTLTDEQERHLFRTA